MEELEELKEETLENESEKKEESVKADLVKLDVDGLGTVGGDVSKKKSDPEEIYREYERLMENGEEFDLRFASVNPAGKLQRMDGPVHVRMQPGEMDGPVWNRKARMIMRDGRKWGTMLLGRTYRVKVIRVDRVNQSVFVSERAVHEDLRTRVCESIDRELDAGKHVQVPARVVGICPEAADRLLVSIGDVGIPGIVNRRDWAITYTISLKDVTHPGDYINVAITGKVKWSPTIGIDRESLIYACSRAETLDEDPWKGIEEKITKKSGVRVRCVAVSKGRFYGAVDGIDDINAVCEMREQETGDLVPEVGKEYLGFVYEVSEEARTLRIRIIGEAPGDSDGDEITKE